MSRSLSHARTERQAREDTAAFIRSWHARGGYEGALARLRVAPSVSRTSPCWQPVWAIVPGHPTACTIHMPFLHKHCGEWR